MLTTYARILGNARAGYDAPRLLDCPCGWEAKAPGLRAANGLRDAHLAEGCEGCDHAVHMEEGS